MVELFAFLKKLGQEVGVQIGLEITRGFLNEKIKGRTPAEVHKAIVTNQDLWIITPGEMKQAGHNLKGRFGGLLEEYKNEINTDRILEWLYKDHQDLHSMIINTHQPSGIIWLNNQVEKIKKAIIEDL